MTQAFHDMIYLFSCALQNIDPILTKKIDLLAVQEEAINQGVWPFVFTSLKKATENGSLVDNENLIPTWNHQLLLTLMQYTHKNALTASTLQKLQSAGIPCCIIKGETIAALYATPQCRMSGDVDVLIPKIQEREACKILENSGYELMSRGAGLPHVEAFHQEAGVLELHVSLYDSAYGEQWFPQNDSIVEEPREFPTEYGNFLQLGYTDGALFLFFHFVKHFLGRGGGIKQLADVLTYFSANAAMLDWKRIAEKVLHAKCERLLAHIIGIGVRYLGFSAEQFPPADYDEVMLDRLLEDLYERGGFSRRTDEESEIRLPYLKNILEADGKDGEKYLQKKQRQSTMSMLFPRRKTMEANYPYVMKSAFLVPVAWIHRAFRFIFYKTFGRIKHDSNASQESIEKKETNMKRLILAKDLKML